MRIVWSNVSSIRQNEGLKPCLTFYPTYDWELAFHIYIYIEFTGVLIPTMRARSPTMRARVLIPIGKKKEKKKPIITIAIRCENFLVVLCW